MARTRVNSEKQPLVISEVEAENFLSLREVHISLDSLTVLVGPNGGGKSNFLSIFRFLGEVARTDLAPAVHNLFGGFRNMFFRGETKSKWVSVNIKAQVTEYSSPSAPDEYSLSFRPFHSRRDDMLLRRESVMLKRYQGRGRRITLEGRKVEFFNTKREGKDRARHSDAESQLSIEKSSSALSVLRKIGETHDTKQVGQLAEIFETLRLFDPAVGMARRASLKQNGSQLESNASNLAAVLLRMKADTPAILDALQDDIRMVLPGFKAFRFVEVGGASDAVRVELIEKGLNESTPLERASFGTIRALALFAMLREPNPPKLTCIEEVDHGLHPYALDVLVARLRDAATRTQIVIATHSPALVNRLDPSELRIFERDWDTGESRVVDLDAEVLTKMRDDSGFELGELWFSGALGGTP